METRKMDPYIGVTGFMKPDEVWSVLENFPSDRRRLMCGVLVSSKTLAGGANKHPRRFPPLDLVRGPFLEHKRVLNLIHYNTDTPPSDSDKVLNEMVKVMEIGGARCHGLQLNIAWPAPTAISRFRERFPEAKVVLQIGKTAMDVCRSQFPHDGMVTGICRTLDRYEVDAILLDASGGHGQLLDPNLVNSFSQNGCGQFSFDLGIAGGLAADSVGVLRGVYGRGRFNVDAEGRLRTPDDNLNVVLAQQYVRWADRVLSSGE